MDREVACNAIINCINCVQFFCSWISLINGEEKYVSIIAGHITRVVTPTTVQRCPRPTSIPSPIVGNSTAVVILLAAILFTCMSVAGWIISRNSEGFGDMVKGVRWNRRRRTSGEVRNRHSATPEDEAPNQPPQMAFDDFIQINIPLPPPDIETTTGQNPLLFPPPENINLVELTTHSQNFSLANLPLNSNSTPL